MEEKDKKEEAKTLLIRLLVLFIVLFGCLSFTLLLFYYPLMQSLGFLVTVIGSSIVSVLALVIAKSGFDYATKITQNLSTSWLELLSVYVISLFAMIVSIACLFRVIGWACSHFLNLDIRWFDLPPQ